MSKVNDDKNVKEAYLARAGNLVACVDSIVIMSSNLGVIFKTCGETNANSYLENAFLLLSFLNLEIEALIDGTLVLDSREHLKMNEGYVSSDQRGSWREKQLNSNIALTKVCYQYLIKIEPSSGFMVIFKATSSILSCAYLSIFPGP